MKVSVLIMLGLIINFSINAQGKVILNEKPDKEFFPIILTVDTLLEEYTYESIASTHSNDYLLRYGTDAKYFITQYVEAESTYKVLEIEREEQFQNTMCEFITLKLYQDSVGKICNVNIDKLDYKTTFKIAQAISTLPPFNIYLSTAHDYDSSMVYRSKEEYFAKHIYLVYTIHCYIDASQDRLKNKFEYYHRLSEMTEEEFEKIKHYFYPENTTLPTPR